jgi:protein disulfide-isomerase-like protein
MRFQSIVKLTLAAVLIVSMCAVSASAADDTDSAVLVLTPDNFESTLKDATKPVFIKFYAPWCGHCKKMAPAYEELATKIGDKAIIAHIDASAHKDFNKKYGVRGFPTLLVFRDGDKAEPEKHTGGRSVAAMEAFVLNGGKPAPSPAAAADDSDSAVLVLTPDNFESTLKDATKPVFIKFYAPWCGHCKKMAPAYEELATKIGDKAIIAHIDASAHKDFNKKYGVRGFPTLLMFRDGDKAEPEKHTGGRSVAAMEAFVLKKDDAPAAEVAPPTQDPDSDVLVINKATFDATLKDAKLPIFIKFYAPWCGHCKKMIPAWNGMYLLFCLCCLFCLCPPVRIISARSPPSFTMLTPAPERVVSLYIFLHCFLSTELATKMKGKAIIAKYDSAEEKSVPGRFGVRGFPTLMLFRPGADQTKPEKFSGKREVDAFVTFIESDPVALAAEAAAKEAAEIAKEAAVEAPVQDPSNPVLTLNPANFDSVIESSKVPVFVKFYAPWCGHCKKMAESWKELAANVKGSAVIAEFDANAFKVVPRRYGVRGFPTLLLFDSSNPESPVKYTGKRELDMWTEFLPTPPAIKLSYFGTRGRAEAIRLVLEQAGLTYEQEHHTGDTWPEAKAEGIKTNRLPFGQLPALDFDGAHYVQSHAIMKFIGNKYDLMPTTPEGVARVDMILGGVEDLRKRHSKVVYSDDCEALRPDFVSGEAKQWLGYFENLINDDDQYFVDNTLSVADLAVFDLLNIHVAMDQSILNDFPRLSAFRVRIRDLPTINAYLNSDRRPAHQNGPSACFDNAENPSGFNF